MKAKPNYYKHLVVILIYLLVFALGVIECSQAQPITQPEQVNTPINNPLALSILIAFGITAGIISFIGWWSWPELKRAFRNHVLYLEYRFKLWNWKRKRK
jgi:hypothetical protein